MVDMSKEVCTPSAKEGVKGESDGSDSESEEEEEGGGAARKRNKFVEGEREGSMSEEGKGESSIAHL